MVKILSTGDIVPDDDPRAGRPQGGQGSRGGSGQEGPRQVCGKNNKFIQRRNHATLSS